MQSEELDKKIREAADHHHPAYDENAWAGMEKLLDTHLPQKKDDRKRFIFFLLFFLLLGGATTLFFVSKNKNEKRPVLATNQPAAQKSSNAGSTSSKQKIAETNDDDNSIGTTTTVKEDNKINNNNNSSVSATNPTNPTNTTGTTNTIFQQPTATNVQFVTSSSAVGKKKKGSKGFDPANNTESNKPYTDKQKEATNIPDLKNNNQNKDVIGVTKSSGNTSGNNTTSTTGSNLTISNQEPVKKDGIGAANKNVTQPAPAEEKTKTSDVVTKENKPKVKSKKSNSFAFTISAGPDISVAGSDKLGKVKLLAGLGLQYTIKDRFTIRTGFYTSRKVYSADPSEYHAPASFYTFYPYLQKVDADCKVYEIPLSVAYNFKGSAKHNFFASAGLSSYLMKNETYNYYYKTTPIGSTYSTKWTILDENKHYFSVMTLSGGYQRNLNKSISLTVEPYLKLPLSGVGYGKVKLNSGGVLFTLGLKPFHQKKEKN